MTKNSMYLTPYKFNGKELDEETGNYYYGARYYNPKWSIWLSVDPLAEKMPSWSSYNYAFSNPINYTDPTGMAPEWVPDSNGNLIAEKNDNAKTLSENYGISMDDANKMVSGLEKDGSGNVKAGQTLKMDNVFSQSIKSSYGDFSMDNPFGRIDPKDNYSCFTSCDRGTAGETIRNPEGNGTNHIEFDGILRNESTPTDINNLVPRSSIARFVYRNGSARHGAVYYGKSNDGTKYFYTKDGVDAAPRITTLNSIISNYGKPKGLKVQKGIIGRIKDWWNDAPATYESGFYTRN